MPGTWTSLNVKGKWLISHPHPFLFLPVSLSFLCPGSLSVWLPEGGYPEVRFPSSPFQFLSNFLSSLPSGTEGRWLTFISMDMEYALRMGNGFFLLQGKSLEKSIFSLVSFGKEMERGQKKNSFDFDVRPNCC